MKRVIVILVMVGLLLSGCAGYTEADIEAARQEGYQQGYNDAKVTSPTTAPTIEPTPTPTPTPAPTVAPTPEPTLSIGARKCPAKLNETVTITISSNSRGTGKMELTLIEVIRGADAWEIIEDANMFNDPAPEGGEYILAKFKVTFILDTSGTDTALDVNRYDFDYATGNYSIQDLPSLVMPEPEFDLKLYEGASGEGYVAFQVSQSETNPMAVFLDNIWFSLT